MSDYSSILLLIKSKGKMNEINEEIINEFIFTKNKEYNQNNIYFVIDFSIQNDNIYTLDYVLNKCLIHPDFTKILKHCLISSIKYNNKDVLNYIKKQYLDHISSSMENSIIIHFLKLYPSINILNVIENLNNNIVLNQDVIDFLLYYFFRNDRIRFLTPNLIFNYVYSIKLTSNVRYFLSHNELKSTKLYSDITGKIENYKNVTQSWKTFCNIFDTINYNDLIYFLHLQGIDSYNDVPLNKFKQRQLCLLLRTGKINF